MPTASTISDSAGAPFTPSPKERRKPSSMEMNGNPWRSAIARAREAARLRPQPSMALVPDGRCHGAT